MQITDIDFTLGSRKETLEQLSQYNKKWDIAKLKNKTGVNTRHLTTENEDEQTLALDATKKLLGRIDKENIDGLIHVTQSAFSRLPTSACLMQDILNLPKNILAFDLIQGCSGFVYGLYAASCFIGQSSLKKVLVVCADTYSKYILENDKTTRPIFSDGAAAILIENKGTGKIGPFSFVTDGSGGSFLTLHKKNQKENLFMDGKKILQFTMKEVPKVFNDLLNKAHLKQEEIDFFIFHQASAVVLRRLKSRLNIPDEKWYINFSEIGNTTSSTIPIALAEAVKNKILKPNMKIMLMGFGGGVSVAGCIVTL